MKEQILKRVPKTPKDFGIGFVYINGKKFLCDRGEKALKMLDALHDEIKSISPQGEKRE